MLPTWRLKLREARVAWQHGRYDEAGHILADDRLSQFRPAKELARDVAGKMVERAGNRFAQGDTVAGWGDLAAADQLGGQDDAVGQLRHHYAERALAETRRYLAAGQLVAALAQLAKLKRRGLVNQEARICQELATLMQSTEKAAASGHFSEAATAISRAKALVGSAQVEKTGDGTMEIGKRLDEQSAEIAACGSESQRLSTELHTALSNQDWTAVLKAADALIAIAPNHTAARKARRRAWKQVGMDITQTNHGRRMKGNVPLRLDEAALGNATRSTRHSSGSSEGDTVAGKERPERLLLWIDAVGGYLVCLDDEIVIGQPVPGQAIAVPIMADLSRRHAVIRRDAGAYVLDPVHEVTIDGRPATGPTVLSDGQLIQLGESVQLRFRLPHALSSTARLDLESHHKTQPSADGVLLMADSCVLGPQGHCHVPCRNWQNDVVLFRQEDGLWCRTTGPLTVDGITASGATQVVAGARVDGEDFSFTWEPVSV